MSNLSTHIPHPTRQPDNWVNIASRTVFKVSGTLPDTTRQLPDSLTPPRATSTVLHGKNPQPATLCQVSGANPTASPTNPTPGGGCRVMNPTTRHIGKIASCTRSYSYARRRCRVVSGKPPDTLNAVQDGKNGGLSGCQVGWHMLPTPGLGGSHV